MSVMQRIVDFFTKKSTVAKGGGDKAISKQKAGGKMTARERIAALLDEGSFHEYDLFVEHNCQDFGMGSKELAADGVITGSGTIVGARSASMRRISRWPAVRLD